MSLEISTDIFSHSKNVAGNFHRHFSSLETSPTFIGTVEMPGAGNFHRHFSLSQNVAGNFHRHFFLSQLKCRWKFPPTFSLTAKMSLEIYRHFSSLETSPTFIGTVEMPGAGNFQTFFSLSQNVAGNFHRHFFLSQLKCRWKFPPTFSFTAKVPLKISTDIFPLTAKMSL